MADPQGASRLLTDDEVGIGTASGAAPRLLSDADVGIVPAAPRDTSFTGALRYGAGEALRAGASTARVLGDRFENETAQGIGRTLDGALPADPNYDPAGPHFVEGIRNLDRRAIDYFPRAVTESLPGFAGTLAAGAAGAAVGGPVGGLAAAGTMGAAQTFGPTAEARAANNGTARPTDADLLAAGGTALVSGALDAVGARGASLVRPHLPTQPQGFARRAGEVATSSGREAVTEGGQSVVGQVGQTAGTEAGLSVDPAQVVGDAAVGLGTSGATRAPGAALRGVVESAAIRGGERAMGDMPPAQAESIARLNDLLAERHAQVRERTGRDPAMEDVLNGARMELDRQIASHIRQAEDHGWLDHTEAQEIRGVFENARRHNQELPDEVAGDGDQIAQGLARLDNLNRAPTVFTQNMRALLTDLDNLSQAARKKNLTGPFESFGRVAGGLAGVGLGAAAGGPFGAVAAAAGAVGGAPLSARVGATVGRFVDRLAGTRMPTMVLARNKALRILRENGVQDHGNTRALQGELERVLGDENLARRANLGLPIDEDTMAKSAARAAQRKWERDRDASLKNEIADQWDVVDRENKRAEKRRRDEDRAWAVNNPQSATPDEIGKLIDKARASEAARRANDIKRAPVTVEDQRPGAESEADPSREAAVLASEVRGYEAERAAIARAKQTAQRAAEAEARRVAAERAQAEAADEAELARRAASDQRAEASQARSGAKQAETAERTRQAAIDAAHAAREAADEARRAAGEARAYGEQPDAEPNLDAVTKSQVSEWEATLAARAEARNAAAKASAQSKPAGEAPLVQKAARKTAKRTPTPKPEERPVAVSRDTEATQLPEIPPEPADDAPSAGTGGSSDPSLTVSGDYGGPKRGWRRYVQRALESKGATATDAEVEAAVREIGTTENTDPEMVDAIVRHAGNLDQKLLDAIIGVTAKNQGWNFASSPDAAPGSRQGGPGGNGYWNGVHKPAAWQGAADYIQGHIQTYRSAALAGDRDLGTAQALGTLGMPDSQVSKESKRQIARAALKAAPEGQREFRAAALAPWLNETTPETTPTEPPAPTPATKPRPKPTPAPGPEADAEPAPKTPRVLTSAEVIARLEARKPSPDPTPPPPKGRALMDGLVGSREPLAATAPSPAELAQRRSAANRAMAEQADNAPIGRTTTTINGQEVEVTDALLAQAERMFRSMSEAQQRQFAPQMQAMLEANRQWKRLMINAEKVDKGADR